MKLEIDEKNLKNENLLKELEGLKNIIDIKDKENNELKNQINSKKELEAVLFSICNNYIYYLNAI